MTLFKRSNDVEVSISPEFDKEYRARRNARSAWHLSMPRVRL